MWSPKTHIRLGVDDAVHSAAFYEALLGGPPAHRSAKLAVFEFDSPALVLTVEECPRAVRSKARRANPSQSSRATPDRAASLCGQARFALLVTAPNHVGDAAIRLRRAGIRLRVEDEGIEAHDPDGNAWRVRFVPSTPVPTVVAS